MEGEAIEQAIDRREALVAARPDLVEDALEAMSERAAAERAGMDALVQAQRVVGDAERAARPNVQVGGRDVVAVRGEIDALVGGVVKLAAQRGGDWPEVGAEASTI